MRPSPACRRRSPRAGWLRPAPRPPEGPRARPRAGGTRASPRCARTKSPRCAPSGSVLQQPRRVLRVLHAERHPRADARADREGRPGADYWEAPRPRALRRSSRPRPPTGRARGSPRSSCSGGGDRRTTSTSYDPRRRRRRRCPVRATRTSSPPDGVHIHYGRAPARVPTALNLPRPRAARATPTRARWPPLLAHPARGCVRG